MAEDVRVFNLEHDYMILIIGVQDVVNGGKESHYVVLIVMVYVEVRGDIMPRNVGTKPCKICNRRYIVTTSKTRRSWRENPKCRECRYICQEFYRNGNLLQEYWR